MYLGTVSLLYLTYGKRYHCPPSGPALVGVLPLCLLLLVVDSGTLATPLSVSLGWRTVPQGEAIAGSDSSNRKGLYRASDPPSEPSVHSYDLY